MHRQVLIGVAACLLTAASGVAVGGEDDAEAARAARNAGLIQSLSRLLGRIEADCNARFVEAELDEEDGRWFYEIKLLGPQGDVAELEYDAHSFRLVEAEGRRLSLLGCVAPDVID